MLIADREFECFEPHILLDVTLTLCQAVIMLLKLNITLEPSKTGSSHSTNTLPFHHLPICMVVELVFFYILWIKNDTQKCHF